MRLESTRILKKLDGFSVLLALVMASAFQSLYSLSYEFSARITSWMGGSTELFGYGDSRNWQDIYLSPVINTLVWLVGIELVLQISKYFKSQHKK